MIDPATGWFEIVDIPTNNLNVVMGGNDEYINKSSSGVRQLFNNTRHIRYLRPCKVVFENGYGFKQGFTPLLKYFDIKLALTTIKNPQYNTPVERLHQLILNMLITKDLDNRVLDHIDPWGEILAYIE